MGEIKREGEKGSDGLVLITHLSSPPPSPPTMHRYFCPFPTNFVQGFKFFHQFSKYLFLRENPFMSSNTPPQSNGYYQYLCTFQKYFIYYGKIPYISLPHLFYTNKSILYIHHSVPCLFFLTIHFESPSLSPAREEPAHFFMDSSQFILCLYPNLLTSFLLMDIYVESNILLIQRNSKITNFEHTSRKHCFACVLVFLRDHFFCVVKCHGFVTSTSWPMVSYLVVRNGKDWIAVLTSGSGNPISRT